MKLKKSRPKELMTPSQLREAGGVLQQERDLERADQQQPVHHKTGEGSYDEQMASKVEGLAADWAEKATIAIAKWLHDMNAAWAVARTTGKERPGRILVDMSVSELQEALGEISAAAEDFGGRFGE